MKQRPVDAIARRIFVSAVALSLFSALIIAIAGLRRIPEAPLWKGAPAFNARNAYEWTRKLARGFPNRVPWGPERQGASNFIQRELKTLGYPVSTITFDEIIGGRKVDGLENIYAVLPGTELPNEYLVVLAHYDITDTTIEGAADDASGVGTVLELARVFTREPRPKRSIVFLATDSEEFGAFWGAHNFIRKFPHADKIVAAVSLDFVAPDHQRDIMVLSDGLQKGYAPLWLREMALASIRAVPFPADDTRHVLEFVQRAILIPPADHGAFLKASIPAINLFGRSENFSHQMAAIHHTPEDNMTHLELRSFEPYGKAAEILLRSLDRLPPMLHASGTRLSDYWKITNTLYISGPATIAFQLLLFVPFLVHVVLLILKLRGRRAHIVNVMRDEAKHYAILLISFLAGYALLRLLPELRIITKYEMFPATQKSLILYKPAYLALVLTAGAVVAIYFALAKYVMGRTLRPSTNLVDIGVRHSVMGLILAIVVMLAAAKNIYLATLLLLPPAYLWMAMRNSRRLNSRMMNLLLFLGGFVTFAAVCIGLTSVFHVGIFYWYIFLAVAYGLVTAYAAILAFAVLTVGIRILRNLIV